MRILTGTGILIEEIQDYNILANIIYSYDSPVLYCTVYTILRGKLGSLVARMPGFPAATCRDGVDWDVDWG